MGQNNDQYTIPLAIDFKGALTGLDAMDQGLTDITASSKKAATEITAAMTNAAKSGDTLAAKMNEGADAAKGLSDAAKSAGVNLGNTFHPDNTTKVVALRTQLIEIKNQLAQMTLNGQEGSKAFQDLALKAAKLNTVYKETSEALTNLGAKTKGLNAIIEGVRGLAGVFAIGEGALAAFGVTNENTAAAIQKVQGAMALLMGVQEVANILQKDSALMIYLSTFARKAHTETIVAETVALGTETVATEAATVATEGFTTALLTNPIFLVVAALAALTFGIYEMVKSDDSAKKSIEELNKELEAEKENYDSVSRAIDNTGKIKQAEADAQRKLTSEKIKLRIADLESEKETTDKSYQFLLQKLIGQEAIQKMSDKDAKDANAFNENLRKERADLFKKSEDLEVSIKEQGEALKKQVEDEANKRELDALHARQANADALINIGKQSQAYLNQAIQSRIASLKDGEDKEIKLVQQNLAEKLQAIELEKAANLKKLHDDKATLELEYQVADADGKKLINLKISNINNEIKAATAANKNASDLEKQLMEAAEIEKKNIQTKYLQKRQDAEHDFNLKVIGLQEDGIEKTLALLKENADHELLLVDRTNASKIAKLQAYIVILKQLYKDETAAILQNNLKQADIQRTYNATALQNQKGFYDQSRDAQALARLQLAKNDLDAENAKLQALQAAGKKESDQEVINVQNRISALKGQMDKLKQDAKPQSLEELLFPGEDDNQRRFKLFMDSLQQVGAAVDAYTNMLIAQYQKQINAQKQVVSNDDAAISSLQDQLKAEQSLRDKGYANNVTGIQKLIAEKNKQRDEDVRKQEEYQKKMEKVQRAQMIADTALQAVNLATAATKIFLSAADLGPVGEVIAGASVIAMIAAFAYAKAQAFSAANTSTFAEGGVIGGKSHAQGGQKYYSRDASGGIMELEEGEHVTRKSQTEKYLPLLNAINHDKVKDMTGDAIDRLLRGTGIHRQGDIENRDAVAEARQNYSDEVNVIAVTAAQKTPKELVSIDNTLQQMASRSSVREEVYEEDGFIVRKKGNRIIRTRKR